MSHFRCKNDNTYLFLKGSIYTQYMIQCSMGIFPSRFFNILHNLILTCCFISSMLLNFQSCHTFPAFKDICSTRRSNDLIMTENYKVCQCFNKIFSPVDQVLLIATLKKIIQQLIICLHNCVSEKKNVKIIVTFEDFTSKHMKILIYNLLTKNLDINKTKPISKNILNF